MAGEELIGRKIADGRYEIVGLLGEGGMGAVYQARQVAMDRMVALKLILPEVVKSPAAAERFQREMKLTAKIEHPNTIRVYDFGETQGQLFLTMELLRGRTLTQALRDAGRFELGRIVFYPLDPFLHASKNKARGRVKTLENNSALCGGIETEFSAP